MFACLGFNCFIFCLCIYDLVFLFCCLLVYFCDLVFLLLLGSFVLQEQHVVSQYSHISLLVNKEILRLHHCRLDSKVTKPTIIQMQKKHCKQFVELARYKSVVTTRIEFHYSWVYTFNATPRSLRIWATHPPRENSFDPAPPAPLCWSSSSSFPHVCTTTSLNWTVTKLI